MTHHSVDGFYVPPGFGEALGEMRREVYRDGDTTVTVRVPVATPAAVEALCDHLKRQRERHLARMPVERIVAVLDQASRRWLDPEYPGRRLALQILPVVTGFSEAVVAASIDAEMESSLAGDMWRALRNEIGNPGYLDDFCYDPRLQGYRRAFGPDLIVAFFSENIPALPHLLYMRAALVKSACLGKVASGEPTFGPMYLKTIEEIDPELARTMAVLYWQGGQRAVEAAAFDAAGAVIVFGGVEACKALVERIPRRVRLLVHGHKLGFGVIGRAALKADQLTALARAVAFDHCMFDQQACLAPRAYFVERGGEVNPETFAAGVADAMAAMHRRMPKAENAPAEAAAVNQLRAKYEMRELKGDPVRLLAPSRSTAWTVVCEENPGLFQPSPLGRFVRIFSVADVAEALPLIKPLGPFLQNAAVAIADGREADFVRALAAGGVARVTAPGQMALPSMMWHHDGIATLAALLRWCDVEKKAGFDPAAGPDRRG